MYLVSWLPIPQSRQTVTRFLSSTSFKYYTIQLALSYAWGITQMVTLNASDTQKFLQSFSAEIAIVQAGTTIGYHINNKTGRLCIRSGGQTFTIEPGYKKVTTSCVNPLVLTFSNRRTVSSLNMPLPNRQTGTSGASILGGTEQFIVPSNYNSTQLQTYICEVGTSGATRIRQFDSEFKPNMRPVYLNDFSARRNPIYYPRGTQVT